MCFDELNLSLALLATVANEGYDTATPIQAGAIPHVLAGRDVLGSAQTGTGKTAAFALPIIQRLTSPEHESGNTKLARCLVLCPTRELATQIADAFQTYSQGLRLRGVTIYGGVGQRPQVNKLRKGVDVIIATPGRLMDLMEQGHVDLSGIRTLILDEADRMLDMGFIPDIRHITAALSRERQTLMFSATLPESIMKLASQLLTNPVTVQIEPEAPTVDRVEQSVYFVGRNDKANLLAELIDSHGMFRTIVFTRTKHGADRLVKQLRHRDIASEAIHGNKTQNARQRALDNFRGDKTAVLVATDVASRGIDVDGVSHVVNYDLTHEPETYVHRIGRTARAGAEGVAISLCDEDQVKWLRGIERLLGEPIAVTGETPEWATGRGRASGSSGKSGRRSSGKRSGGGGGGGGGGSGGSGGSGGGGKRKSHRKGASASHGGGGGASWTDRRSRSKRRAAR